MIQKGYSNLSATSSKFIESTTKVYNHCKEAFIYLENNNITKNKWTYEFGPIDGKKLTEFSKSSMVKRRKMEFKDLNNVEPDVFNHWLVKSDGVNFFFGPSFTECMKEYNKSINLNIKGLQATSFLNINNTFNLGRFGNDSDSESIVSFFQGIH